MKTLIERPSLELIEEQLKPEFLWRQTNKANNLVYSFHANEAPVLMQEIGRLRELSFRMAGGGTGKSVDIDELDLDPNGYRQLIVWNPSKKEVVGGYRYVCSSDPKMLSTSHYFEFSEMFTRDYLPHTIELGRSFVQPGYQVRSNPKAIFALDNLWDGLGALVMRNPSVKYLFGKVTMYGDYNVEARNILIYFLKRYFPDHDNLMYSKFPVAISIDNACMDALFCGDSYGENYKILLKSVRTLAESVPPLINAYMGLSPTMKVFDTACNPDFGNVEETGILITIDDIYQSKIDRYVTYGLGDVKED